MQSRAHPQKAVWIVFSILFAALLLFISLTPYNGEMTAHAILGIFACAMIALFLRSSLKDVPLVFLAVVGWVCMAIVQFSIAANATS